MSDFADLGLAAPILSTLVSENYTTPTPIQSQAIPPVMAGRDVMGLAQTGTGKTAAFSLPILHRLDADRRRPGPRACRVLVLCPTRELAGQIGESVKTYGRGLRLNHAVVFGGASIMNQIRAMSRGVDILVATPGRLIDLIERRAVRLDEVEILVLDEADHMLDLGFIHAIRRIVKLLPAKRQNLFFSATMPETIEKLAAEILSDPVRVAVTPVSRTADRIDQSVMHVAQGDKVRLLEALAGERDIRRGLVFTRTKHGADKVAKALAASGIASAAIHGNRSQSQRERALADFKSGRIRLLVATDIAARGIDVDGLSHVVNFDLPEVPETYVHRIGRTARAGASGEAIAFCSPEQRGLLRAIERLTKLEIKAAAHPLAQAGAGSPAGARAPNRGPRPARGSFESRGERHQNDRRDERPSYAARGEGRPGGTPRPQERSDDIRVGDRREAPTQHRRDDAPARPARNGGRGDAPVWLRKAAPRPRRDGSSAAR
jgi:ATP-dependent RNA helicase RhlE